MKTRWFPSISVVRAANAGDIPEIDFELNDSIKGPVVISIDDRIVATTDATGGIHIKGAAELPGM